MAWTLGREGWEVVGGGTGTGTTVTPRTALGLGVGVAARDDVVDDEVSDETAVTREGNKEEVAVSEGVSDTVD